MAQKITVALADDLDGGPAGETVRFGFGGAKYEIELLPGSLRAVGITRPAPGKPG